MPPHSGNPIVHLELHTGALQQACDFYASACGWRSHRVAVGDRSYMTLDPGGELHGGAVECGVSSPMWLPYVEVAEIWAATERAQALGANVLLPPREGPSGWRSVVSAPAGGEIAFWQPKR